MTYQIINGVHVVTCPASDFAIKVVDKPKRSAWTDNYCNAGFFSGPYHEKNPTEAFTLPVCNLMADYCIDASKKPWSRKYAEERGWFSGDKWIFNSYCWRYMNERFYGRSSLNLVVYKGKASIVEMKNVTDVPANYVVGGVPLMKDGKDVKFNSYVTSFGWNASTLYATKHIMVGVNRNKPDVVYIMSWKSTTENMILSAEAFRKLNGLGLGITDAIKLDGGGSHLMKVNGKIVDQIATENRQIQNIITFGKTGSTVVPSGSVSSKKLYAQNPYIAPIRTLKKGCTGNDVKWLQWMLVKIGIKPSPGEIDGSFGPGVTASVKAWQKAAGLAVDGSFGPASRQKMMSL